MSVLDFNLLDDVCLANAEQERWERANRTVSHVQFSSAGPLLEYALYRESANRRLPELKDVRQSPAVESLRAALSSRANSRMSIRPLSVEFQRLPTNGVGDAPEWLAFRKRGEGAARRAGFPVTVARGFIGALGEMVDNVYVHSQRADTGIVGYSWGGTEFEYTVADQGVGVLASLQRNPSHRQLADHGRALQLALTDGVSRFGSGRGFGFRQVFKSLANLGAFLRFRSGDHVLQIDGRSPDLKECAVIQRPPFEGFAVSVICRWNVPKPLKKS